MFNEFPYGLGLDGYKSGQGIKIQALTNRNSDMLITKDDDVLLLPLDDVLLLWEQEETVINYEGHGETVIEEETVIIDLPYLINGGFW